MFELLPGRLQRRLWSDRHGTLERYPTLGFSGAGFDPGDIAAHRIIPEHDLNRSGFHIHGTSEVRLNGTRYFDIRRTEISELGGRAEQLFSDATDAIARPATAGDRVAGRGALRSRHIQFAILMADAEIDSCVAAPAVFIVTLRIFQDVDQIIMICEKIIDRARKSAPVTHRKP
jgi:hypothetical protein